jgi:seryl-tRNA synthetase
MPTYTVPLTTPVPAALAGELASRLYHADERITGFTLPDEGTDVAEVVITTDLPVAAAELHHRIGDLVRSDVLPQRVVAPRLLWRSPHRPARRANVYQDLLDSGAVHESAPGQVTVAEPLLGLMRGLDQALLDLARDHFGAEEHDYPHLIPTATLARAGYLGSFPQHVLLTSRVHPHLDGYRAFTRAVGRGTPSPDVVDAHTTHARLAVPPAVCYHTYARYGDRALTAPLTAVTARARCFRHESRYCHSLERLWDFTMRETVLLGEQDQVLAAREAYLTALRALVTNWGLAGHLETANDPFFATPDTARQVWSQRLMELKYELRLPVAEGRTVAAASVNVHGTHLAEAFGITTPSGPSAFTGCVAVGLERLAYAFVHQHGTDPRDWPQLRRPVST